MSGEWYDVLNQFSWPKDVRPLAFKRPRPSYFVDTQSAGATLQLNLLDPSHRDVLHVAGQADFGGPLNVSLAVGASNPQAGDVFDILDFGSASGAFSSFSLPALSAGLAWDTINLLSTG